MKCLTGALGDPCRGKDRLEGRLEGRLDPDRLGLPLLAEHRIQLSTMAVSPLPNTVVTR